MSSVKIQSKVSFNELLSGVEQLSAKDLEAFIVKILALRVKRAGSDLPQLEEQLRKQIAERLSPTQQQKYDVLIQKQCDETLSEKEHQELAAIIEKVEAINAQRASAIFTLSQIRGITPDALMKELEPSKEQRA
jgi:hypothetical protein